MQYEAFDTKNDIAIYKGDSKAGFILTLIEYIEIQRREKIHLINEEDIMKLNVKALDRIGIKISIRKNAADPDILKLA